MWKRQRIFILILSIKPNGDQMNALLLILHWIPISIPPSTECNSALFLIPLEVYIWRRKEQVHSLCVDSRSGDRLQLAKGPFILSSAVWSSRPAFGDGRGKNNWGIAKNNSHFCLLWHNLLPFLTHFIHILKVYTKFISF